MTPTLGINVDNTCPPSSLFDLHYLRLLGDGTKDLFTRYAQIESVNVSNFSVFVKKFCTTAGFCLEGEMQLNSQYVDYLLSATLYSGLFAVVKLGLYSNSSKVSITVSAKSEETALAVIETIRKDLPKSPTENKVIFTFWRRTATGGASSSVHPLDGPVWSDIQHNYTGAASAAITHLTQITNPASQGKIILWHGPPGQGKTYAIRALARDWQTRLGASVELVLDHEALFADADYMFKILLTETDDYYPDDDEPKKLNAPRLIIVEDGAQIFGVNCRNTPGFSRFLNMGDGLIGQASNIVFLLTANEDIGTLDEAVTRPGRCLQTLEIKPLTFEEKMTWLEKHKLPIEAAAHCDSLADLYAFMNGNKTSESKLGIGF